MTAIKEAETTCICTRCNEVIVETDSVVTRDLTYPIICRPCLSHYFITCYNCSDIVRIPNSYESTSEHFYCPSCARELLFCCWGCNEYCDIDDSHSDFDGNLRCEDCWDEYQEEHGVSCCGIHDYHYKPRQYFYTTERRTSNSTETELFMGVELEINNCATRCNVSDVLKLSNDEELFHLEEDSSLDNGFELVTRPFTLKYHEQCFRWEAICRILDSGGGTADYNCGMHIHFNKRFFGNNYQAHTLKLLYIYEKFWENFVEFSGRENEDTINHYASRYGLDFSIKCSSEIPQKLMGARERGRFFAVNIENTNTIEFRISASTLDYRQIYSNLEMCDYLVRFVKRSSIKRVQCLTWETFVRGINPKKYPNLVEYLRKIGLIKGDK